jgi:YfiH family protein
LIGPEYAEVVPDFAEFGVTAFTTTRAFGTVSSASTEPANVVASRWDAIRDAAKAAGVDRLATSHQVHGAVVLEHNVRWHGWLRGGDADGHHSATRGTALGVTIADCVPIFIAHPSGAVAMLHSGWRGTAARIVERGIASFVSRGARSADLRMHLGPAICGKCYEVSADVATQLIGTPQSSSRTVDLRELIASHAGAVGVTQITTSRFCTRHDNARFFSHRAGDPGRQVSIIFAQA